MGCPGKPNCGGSKSSKSSAKMPKANTSSVTKVNEVILNGKVYIPKR